MNTSKLVIAGVALCGVLAAGAWATRTYLARRAAGPQLAAVVLSENGSPAAQSAALAAAVRAQLLRGVSAYETRYGHMICARSTLTGCAWTLAGRTGRIDALTPLHNCDAARGEVEQRCGAGPLSLASPEGVRWSSCADGLGYVVYDTAGSLDGARPGQLTLQCDQGHTSWTFGNAP